MPRGKSAAGRIPPFALAAVLALCASSSGRAAPLPSGERALIEAVLQGNPSLKVQRIGFASARIDLNVASGSRFPRLEINSSLDWTRQETEVAGNPIPGSAGAPRTLTFSGWETDNSLALVQPLPLGGEASLGYRGLFEDPDPGGYQDSHLGFAALRQPLLRGFGRTSEVAYAFRVASLDRNLTREFLRQTVLETVSSTRELYWTHFLVLRRQEVLAADLAYWEGLERTAQAQNSLGLLSQDEFLRIRINVLTARQALVEAEVALRDARSDLVALAGGDSAAADAEVPDSNFAYDYLPSLPDGDSLLFLAREYAPVLRRVALEEERAKASADRAGNRRLPLLDLRLEWSNQLDGGSDRRVGLAASYAFPNREGRGAWRKAVLAVEARKWDGEEARLRLTTALGKEQTGFGADRQNFKLAREKLELETVRNRIARRQYELGAIDFTELSLSQNDRLAAEQEVLSAYVSLLAREIELDRLTGYALRRLDIRWEDGEP